MLQLRCERNPRSKIKNMINAYTAWIALKEFKLRGSGILNFIFKKLNDISLAGCDNNP